MTLLKQLIHALGMTQTDFAKQFGLSKSGLNDIVSGKIKSIPGHVQLKLARDYKVNPNWLISGEGEMFVKTEYVRGADKIETVQLEDILDKVQTDSEELERTLKRILTIYDRLDDEDKAKYLQLINLIESKILWLDEVDEAIRKI